MASGEIHLSTSAKMQFVDITRQLQQVFNETSCNEGIMYVFNPHTTAGLTINEGADPAVREDVIGALKEMLPRNFPYKHMEGNSPSHLLTTIAGNSLQIFIKDSSMQLGTWQRIFFLEFDGPRSRKIFWKIMAG